MGINGFEQLEPLIVGQVAVFSAKALGDQVELPDWQYRYCIALVRLNESQGNLDAALELDDELGEAYSSRGSLKYTQGDFEGALQDLERALESASGDEEIIRPIAEGVQLTLKSFQDALGKFNIVEVDPQGEPFDPNLHQAMSMVENNEVEPNTVIAVMQKGYTLNGRLVRPAMVMVSKAAG